MGSHNKRRSAINNREYQKNIVFNIYQKPQLLTSKLKLTSKEEQRKSTCLRKFLSKLNYNKQSIFKNNEWRRIKTSN